MQHGKTEIVCNSMEMQQHGAWKYNSMEKLNSLLYRNWSVNFFTELLHFTVPPKLTRVGMPDFFRCKLRSVANHVIV